jgi:coenzyme PQQ precursor peptide PqqA
MAWKTPKIVEVLVGMEINMYASAEHKQFHKHLLGPAGSGILRVH